MQSKNFEYLRPTWEDLADLGAFAEQYAIPDPQSAVAKLRTFAEQNCNRDDLFRPTYRAGIIWRSVALEWNRYVSKSVKTMLNTIAKPLLVSTSMSPVLIAYGINALADGKGPWEYLPWFGAAIGMVSLCLLILRFAKTQLEKQHLKVKSIKSSDKEVMTFLLAYLLPLIPAKTIGISGHYLTIVFVFSMFFLAIYYSNAFDFNPLLGLCGYHFYEVQSEDGMTFLLMTRKHLLKPEQVAEVVQLFPYTFLNVGSTA